MGDTAAGGRILVASNRGPLSFTRGRDGQFTARRGGGGVVSGLSAVAEDEDEDMLWVCAALSDDDRAAVRAAGDGLLDWEGASGESAVRMLDLPPDVFDLAYNGVANSTLWFVHHMLFDTPNKPSFGLDFEREWEAFRAYNEAFASALAESVKPDEQARAVIQDYHLCLAPLMLARQAEGVRIAHFSHTPWAPPDYYRILPDAVGREVLAGILGADHAGFLTRRWADAFMDCCEEFLDCAVDRTHRQVCFEGHRTSVGVHPLGVDADLLRERADQPDVRDRIAALEQQTAGRQVVVRVDRTELSKNIVRGLEAYRDLLRRYPEWHGRVTKLAFAYPSRGDLAEYQEYTAAVERLAAEITDEFAVPGWDPLILEVNDDYARSLAALRLADVLLVIPIRDGMNLVAKEGPILSNRGCALVLSTEAGAAAELSDAALMVNPYDVTQTAQALHDALGLSQAERSRRSAVLAAAAGTWPPTRWFADQLRALDEP